MIRKRIRPGGVVAFSHLPAIDAVSPVAAVTKWNSPAERWVELLAAAGFVATADVIAAPDDQQVGTLLVRASAA